MLNCHRNSLFLWDVPLTGIDWIPTRAVLHDLNQICLLMNWHSITNSRIYQSLHIHIVMFRYEGLVFSVGGNGRSYVIILEAGPLADTSQSKMYFARISTKVGFCRVSGCYVPRK